MNAQASHREPAQQHPSLMAMLAWASAVAGLTAYVGYVQAVKTLREDIVARPRIAVLDVGAIATTWRIGDTPAQRVRNGLEHANAISRELTAQGYLVIDRKYVLSAPEGMTVEGR